jgi:hypothetical protein
VKIIKAHIPGIIALAVIGILLYVAFTVNDGKDQEIAKLQKQVRAIKYDIRINNNMVEDIAWDLNHRLEKLERR